MELKTNIAKLELIGRTTNKAILEIEKAERYLDTQNAKLRELMQKSAELDDLYRKELTRSALNAENIEKIRTENVKKFREGKCSNGTEKKNIMKNLCKYIRAS